MIDFKPYYNMLGLNETQTARVEELVLLIGRISDEPIEDVFMSQGVEIIPPDQKKSVPQSLWFFSKGSLFEAKNFLSETVFDRVMLDKNLHRWELRFKDYKPGEKPKETSMFRVEIAFPSVRGALVATGTNCDVLWRIFNERFTAHLRAEPL